MKTTKQRKLACLRDWLEKARSSPIGAYELEKLGNLDPNAVLTYMTEREMHVVLRLVVATYNAAHEESREWNRSYRKQRSERLPLIRAERQGKLSVIQGGAA